MAKVHSGNETAIHLNENGRITLMWCSFGDKPNIVRVYGKGNVIPKESDEFIRLHERYFEDYPKEIVRQLFNISIYKVTTSCGWGVPIMTFSGDRSKLHDKSLSAFIKDDT